MERKPDAKSPCGPAAPKQKYRRPRVQSEAVTERLALASGCGEDPTAARDCGETP